MSYSPHEAVYLAREDAADVDLLLRVAFVHGNCTYYYEPLCGTAYRVTMENTYENTLVAFIRAWHNSSMHMAEYPLEEHGVWMNAPKQPDGSSCGVMCIAQAYDMLKDSSRFNRTTVSREDVAIMRLRILWVILMHPDVTGTSNAVARAVESSDIDLLATIKT